MRQSDCVILVQSFTSATVHCDAAVTRGGGGGEEANEQEKNTHTYMQKQD